MLKFIIEDLCSEKSLKYILFGILEIIDLNVEAKFAGNLFQQFGQMLKKQSRRNGVKSDHVIKEKKFLIKCEEDLTKVPGILLPRMPTWLGTQRNCMLKSN